MYLPNIDRVIVESSKIIAYLLSEENTGGKAGFFTAFGFHREKWEDLKEVLIQHARTHEIATISVTQHGVKYIIEGEIQMPDKRFVPVRSVWIVDVGMDAPRLVTAYPL